MIPIKIDEENIEIRNVEIYELKEVCECLNETVENMADLGRTSIFTFDELKQRYLESLVNSLEYFCGIYADNKIIGIVKGRIESKLEPEFWIFSILLCKDYRRKGYGTKVLHTLENYFYERFNIHNFYTLVTTSNKYPCLKFWFKNDYTFVRDTNSSLHTKDYTLSMKIFHKRR